MSISDSLKRFNDPIWTVREVNKFWEVVEPYLKRLLMGDLPLPEHNIDFNKMNSCDQCMEHVHDCMWRGKYTLAVANLRAILKFFDGGGKSSGVIIPSTADELRQLKRIFTHEPLRR